MEITVVPAVGVVIVFHATVAAIPISGVELLPIVTRPHPVRAFIRGTRPIASVPAIAAIYRVLISVDPEVARTGRGGTGHNYPRRWRRANANADGNLRAETKSAADEEQSE